ncbi:MAG: guanitoxin biosynthesis heme-dependent pre-guanitoxin N-hydroxylase GntA [Candidatus Baltobacteraceae bacterium]
MNALQALSLYETPNPYDFTRARAASNYTGLIKGALLRLLDFREVKPRSRFAHSIFRAFLSQSSYPCLGAKAALNAGTYRFATYEKMASPGATAGLARDLCAFVAERPLMESEYATFVAFFDDAICDELAFEHRLWTQLQALRELDRPQYAHDPSVSEDTESARFAFSFAGTAFFVVGMHPKSSRLARRFLFPALVFNAHVQFDALRAKGLYERFKLKVRERDLALQGSLNPNLSEFGERSEARQYSGRPVEESWKCPFHP